MPQRAKIYALGDIHGCLDRLTRLLEKMPVDGKVDTVVFLGDYIDRGPDSRGVVEALISLKQSWKNVICLMGNHEQMFLDYLSEGREMKELYLANGGAATLVSYGCSPEAGNIMIHLPESHRQFFSSLLPFYETEDFIFVHAGLRPGIPLAQQDPEDLLWIRREFYDSTYDFGKRVIFAHTPFSAPLLEPKKIGLDTGAVYGGQLTCIELTEMVLYQA